ncbi:uncharacterized protein LOC134854901 [Symsagittifera roscoffensis]|uniref:uncharacterized protein LOC134854901 n=1 Tax=Symsagittifera roscoffensis TaxID=84072 RepID=UPI00307B9500
MAHECCSEFCRRPLKPPPFPQELVKYLSPHLADLFNYSSFALNEFGLIEAVEQNEDERKQKYAIISLPFSTLISSKYVTSFYPVIGALLLLVVVLLIMRVSIFFKGKLPKTLTRPLSRSCLKRNDSIHEYDAIGMTTTEVNEISPVFLCLQPYNEHASCTKSEARSSATEHDMPNTPHSSPLGSTENNESFGNERCSSVLSASTIGDASSARRKQLGNVTSPNTAENSLQSSVTNNSFHSSLKQSNNRLNQQRNSHTVCNGVILMGSPSVVSQNSTNTLTHENKPNVNNRRGRLTAVSRMTEKGSITSVLSNGTAHPVAYNVKTSDRYISC